MRRDRDGSYETVENCTTFSVFKVYRSSGILTCGRLRVGEPRTRADVAVEGSESVIIRNRDSSHLQPMMEFLRRKVHINDCLRPTLERLFPCPCFNSWRHLALDLGIYRQLIIKDMNKTSTDLALYIHCT